MFTPANIAAALLALLPYLGVAFFPQAIAARVRSLPLWAQLTSPVLLCIPYLLVACSAGIFRWQWLAVYAALPVAIAILLWQASRVDSGQCGNWRDFLVLAALGLAVDLRWFEGAWPPHLANFNKILLLDAGIYGFTLIRRLDGTGFDLRLRLKDVGIGLREAAFYTPIALTLGLSLGFLHAHLDWPGLGAHCLRMALHLLLHRCSRGTVLPRLASEPAGEAHGALRRFVVDRLPFRPGSLQQTDHRLQLALRIAGGAGRHLLRPRVAAGAPRRRIGRHSRHSGRHLVSMAALADAPARCRCMCWR